MKVNLALDKDSVIVGFSIFPFDSALPTLEVADPYTDILIGVDSFVDGKLVKGTPKTNNYAEILRLKRLLEESDYKALKYAEGELTEDEYASTKEQRRLWRTEINALQDEASADAGDAE